MDVIQENNVKITRNGLPPMADDCPWYGDNCNGRNINE